LTGISLTEKEQQVNQKTVADNSRSFRILYHFVIDEANLLSDVERSEIGEGFRGVIGKGRLRLARRGSTFGISFVHLLLVRFDDL